MITTKTDKVKFDVSENIVHQAKARIRNSFNRNLIFTLADHINFAIQRGQHYGELQLPFTYEIEQFYPEETALGHFAVDLIKQELGIELPNTEIAAIAMHLINSQLESKENITDIDGHSDGYLINQITIILKQEFDTNINTKSFEYNRFVMHLRYYLKRIKNNEQVSQGDFRSFIDTIREKEPEVYICTKRIIGFLEDRLEKICTDDEIFYLMIYIKRMASRIQ
ncbi:PRD domain-containing protein [Streptococcus dentasini]